MSALDYRAKVHPQKLARQATWLRAQGRDATELEQALVRATRCKRCGRRLTNPESAEAGIGPECRTKEAE